MAPYLLLDRPELGPGAAVRDSVVLMKGWKWELFKLDLSFLGEAGGGRAGGQEPPGGPVGRTAESGRCWTSP